MNDGVSITTEPRTTAAGLVLPRWDDECSARSPFALAMPGAFSRFTACLVVDWFGAQCDDARVERKTVTQRCLPYDGPRLHFGELDEHGMRVLAVESLARRRDAVVSCPECHGDPSPPTCPRCSGRGSVRFR